MNIRQSRILEMLEKHGRISLSEIKEVFPVSEMTIRRDLAALEEEGYATRIHGGVIAQNRLFFDGSFLQKEKAQVAEKKAIARKAAGLVEAGENIILDTGTTTLHVARELVKTNRVFTVATTSLAVASVLFNSTISVLIFGGFLRREIPDLVGPLTEKNLSDFHAHKLFMGCDGVVPGEGFYTSDLNISRIEEIMVKTTDRVIVVTDSTKFGRKSFARYADFSSVDTIITDGNIHGEVLRQLEEAGVEVMIAEV
jgi:DeoR/GlpR family transcriptional regulator of sugar metabolism